MQNAVLTDGANGAGTKVLAPFVFAAFALAFSAALAPTLAIVVLLVVLILVIVLLVIEDEKRGPA